MKKIAEEHIVQAKAALSSKSTTSELARHKLAATRYAALADYKSGKLSAEKAMRVMGARRALFFRLLKRIEGAKSYRVLVTERTKRKEGLMATNPEVLKLIEEMFLEHYPDSKKVSIVWAACQAQADNRRMLRPSYHTVKRWIETKGEPLLYAMTHSTDQTKQRYEARAGYKVTKRPLEWVQFDHAVVDLLVVDENDRSVIIGRPWISLAVDLHTRVVLGFYLSDRESLFISSNDKWPGKVYSLIRKNGLARFYWAVGVFSVNTIRERLLIDSNLTLLLPVFCGVPIHVR